MPVYAQAPPPPSSDPWIARGQVPDYLRQQPFAQPPPSGPALPVHQPPVAYQPPRVAQPALAYQPPAASEPELAKPTPVKKSWIKERVLKHAKLLVVAVFGGIAYGGHSLYVYRQPYEWSGTVETQTVSVGSRTGGRVKDVLVHEGDEVKAGTVIVLLETGDLEARKIQAEADVEAAEAALDKLSNGARPEELAQAAARVASMRAAAGKEYGRASQEQKDFARTQTLFSGGAISVAERESKQGAVHAAAGAAVEAGARAREAEAALRLLAGGTRVEDFRIAKANVAVAKAKLEMMKTLTDELSVRAPRDSRIESITVRPGDLLRENVPAATLLEKGQLYVRIFVPETQIGRIKVGQEVPISVDSFPGRAFKGRVGHINELGEFTPHRLTTAEDRASQVFGARVSVSEGEQDLRAGMAAFIHVPKR